MKVKENALKYFKLFEEGNDVGLSEMYDENGIMLNEELLTVKFINEEDLDETADE